jgi:hypothetical protein
MERRTVVFFNSTCAYRAAPTSIDFHLQVGCCDEELSTAFPGEASASRQCMCVCLMAASFDG